MKRNELYNQLNHLFDEECGIELYVVLKSKSEKNVKKLNIKDEKNQNNNTSNELMKGYIEAVKNALFSGEDQDIMKLSSADERKNTIYYYDLEELPYEMKMLTSVSDYMNNISYFDFSEDSLDNIQGFIVRIGTQSEYVVIYKQHYAISLLNRDKCMLTPIPHKNRMEKYDKEILRMDFNCHFMLWDDKIYIFDVDKMEKICSFTDIIRKEAEKSIEIIEELDIVDNMESLNDELDNMTFARKLTRIYKDSKVIGKVSKEGIINFSQTHSYFKKNPIKLNDDKDKFILDSKRAKNAFIKLLNDDLLMSQLTEAEYESLAKNDA